MLVLAVLNIFAVVKFVREGENYISLFYRIHGIAHDERNTARNVDIQLVIVMNVHVVYLGVALKIVALYMAEPDFNVVYIGKVFVKILLLNIFYLSAELQKLGV